MKLEVIKSKSSDRIGNISPRIFLTSGEIFQFALSTFQLPDFPSLNFSTSRYFQLPFPTTRISCEKRSLENSRHRVRVSVKA